VTCSQLAVPAVVLFLAFDAAVKLMGLDVAVEATTRLGYPADLVVIIGVG
jgi:hypothetical protein